jgi:hypothetical protein
MAYGTVKVDNITFDNGGSDQNVTVSGLYNSLTSGITVTGTISGAVVIGSTSVSGTTVAGVTVTGTTVQGASGTFTSLTGTTTTGTTSSFTSGVFTNISGTTATITSGIIASGTAAAPSLAILADLDTGLYSPGADQVAIATNGTGRLFVDASGNVGVGTSSVNALLEVNNSTAGGEVQRIEGNYSGSGSVTLTNWRRAGGSVAAAFKYNDETSPLCMSIGTTTSHEFRIRTADTDAITIDASQRVGIGTSAPGYTLDVAGTFRSTGIARLGTGQTTTLAYIGNPDAAGNKYITFGRASALTDIVNIQGVDAGVGSANIALQASGGNVGIGTTDFGGKLTVRTSTSNGAPLNWDSGQLVVTTGTGAASLGIALSVSSADNSASITSLTPGVTWNPIHYRGSSHIFYKSDASTNEVARLDTSGRLLVGTSSSRDNLFNTTYSALFQVESQATANAQASLTSTTAGVNGANLILCHQRSGSVGGNTVVQSDDQLGILSFQGADGTEMVPAASIEAYVDGTPGANDMPGRLVFSTTADGASSPTERMRITSTGQVRLAGAGITFNGDTATAFHCPRWHLYKSWTFSAYTVWISICQQRKLYWRF